MKKQVSVFMLAASSRSTLIYLTIQSSNIQMGTLFNTSQLFISATKIQGLWLPRRKVWILVILTPLNSPRKQYCRQNLGSMMLYDTFMNIIVVLQGR